MKSYTKLCPVHRVLSDERAGVLRSSQNRVRIFEEQVKSIQSGRYVRVQTTTAEEELMRTMRMLKVLTVVVFLLIPAFARGQIRCDLPNIYGVASIRGDKTYLAVWRHSDQEEDLDIYGGLQCFDAIRVAHFEDKGIHWQSISAIEDSAVLGFRIRTEAGDDWFGATKLFMYDGKKFRKAFDSGEVTEVIDLDGDGFPEVLEFLANKGRPNGKVRVWIWRTNQFKVFTTVTTSEIYSARLLSLLSSASGAVTRKTNP
jgi:hypothetical protein